MQKSKLGRPALIVHSSHVDTTPLAQTHTATRASAQRRCVPHLKQHRHPTDWIPCCSNQGPGWPEVWGHSKERPGAGIINVYWYIAAVSLFAQWIKPAHYRLNGGLEDINNRCQHTYWHLSHAPRDSRAAVALLHSSWHQVVALAVQQASLHRPGAQCDFLSGAGAAACACVRVCRGLLSRRQKLAPNQTRCVQLLCVSSYVCNNTLHLNGWSWCAAMGKWTSRR